MNVETNSLAYSMILDDLLQNFSFELGIDMDNNETPFGLYWKAVSLKGHQKNGQLTNFTRNLRELHATNDATKQNIYNFMNLIDMDESVPYRIKNFILDFGKDRSTWNFRDQDGIMQVKHKFNAALDQTYMWGYVDNDVIIDFWNHLENPTDSQPKPAEPPKQKPVGVVVEPVPNRPNPEIQILEKEMQKEDPLVKPQPMQRAPENLPKILSEVNPSNQSNQIVQNEPENVPLDPHITFKMNNNPSQFPRKPSNNIRGKEMQESGPPDYQGKSKTNWK